LAAGLSWPTCIQLVASLALLVLPHVQVNARVAAKLAAQEAEAAAAAAGDDKARAALKKKGLLGADGAPAVQNPLKDDRFKWVTLGTFAGVMNSAYHHHHHHHHHHDVNAVITYSA
jgi:hypothetical protein